METIACCQLRTVPGLGNIGHGLKMFSPNTRRQLFGTAIEADYIVLDNHNSCAEKNCGKSGCNFPLNEHVCPKNRAISRWQKNGSFFITNITKAWENDDPPLPWTLGTQRTKLGMSVWLV